MSSSSIQPSSLSPEQLDELAILTHEVERAMIPVIREREERASDETKEQLLQSIHKLKDV